MADMGLAEGIDLLAQRAKIVKAMLAAGLVMVVAVLIGEIGELQGRISLDNPELSSFEALYAAALLLSLVVLVATYVLFGMWVYRAAANVEVAAVPGFDYTPGWAVGWFFVPFANLFKPFAAMRQIWNASHGNESGDLDSGNPFLAFWWGLWILTAILTNVAIRLNLNPEDPSYVRTALQLETASSVLSLALYPIAYRLVDRITRAQQERLTAAHIFA